MQQYADTDNDSNVDSYEIGDWHIIVKFQSGDDLYYKYTYRSASRKQVEEMKVLARKGDGLNAYINNNDVQYESKW